MGYDVHITRKPFWADDEGLAITLEDWLSFVQSDPEMRADGYAEANTPEGSLRIEEPGIAVWTAYSRHDEQGNMAWFSHFEDHVSVKNPDPEILRKMHQIAQNLDAKVQGDEGEEYDADGKVIADEPNQPPQKPWWRFWG